MTKPSDRLIVLSSLFPSDGAPVAGLFIRERMFRVGRQIPLLVLAPLPWSPLDWLIRFFKPEFRPQARYHEVMNGVDVYRPRFFSVPVVLKRFDGWLMGKSVIRTMRLLSSRVNPVLVDAHFLFPDGYAAMKLADHCRVPLTVSMRGNKDRSLLGTSREAGMRKTVHAADRVFSVSGDLTESVGVPLGLPAKSIRIIGNGIDTERFSPVDKAAARKKLDLPDNCRVLVTVGHLVPVKGFHRVIETLPQIRRQYPDLIYLIVGGGASQGSFEPELRKLVASLGLSDVVRFCGAQPPDELKWYYSAADLLVMASEYEGWANVLLEAMACELPVVVTEVGGNREVVKDSTVGSVVPYWQPTQFAEAVCLALAKNWDRCALRQYASSHSWDNKIVDLVAEFRAVLGSNEATKRIGND